MEGFRTEKQTVLLERGKTTKIAITMHPEVKTEVNGRDGAEMVFIGPGEFTMSRDGGTDTAPQHKVNLGGYWIYRYPVTVAQFRRYCSEFKLPMPQQPFGALDDYPVVNVSWEEAKAYCSWAGVRLPTEAEWEKAARGVEARVFPWSSEWDSNRIHAGRGGNLIGPVSVGHLPQGASSYEVHDLVGNVQQWCSDWYDPAYYGRSPSDNPDGPGKGKLKVIRGSSWKDKSEESARCYVRAGDFPTSRSIRLGFRCVR
jgi:iron(II)-dependent oxidoreductase